MGDYAENEWRVGRKLGRTIYAVMMPADGWRKASGEEDCDVFLGMMETRELAEHVVERHNASREGAR